MLTIDGSQGEGGGQVLRTALALSMVGGTPIHITRIRARRRNPDLAAQHLAGVLASAALCDAEASGTFIGSTDVYFAPSIAPQPGIYDFDISKLAARGSAGAVTLLLQTILLPLALADGPSTITLHGGTHVAWSPTVHYADAILLPFLRQIGLSASLTLDQWGWYPQGGGQITVEITGGADLSGITLTERGDLLRSEGLAGVTNLPAHIPQRISNRATNLLKEVGIRSRIEPTITRGPSTGAFIFLRAIYENIVVGFSELGRKGMPSEEVAGNAVAALLRHHEAAGVVDANLADQVIPFLALADGPSEMTISAVTGHTRTNAVLTTSMTGREVEVIEHSDGTGTLRVF